MSERLARETDLALVRRVVNAFDPPVSLEEMTILGGVRREGAVDVLARQVREGKGAARRRDALRLLGPCGEEALPHLYLAAFDQTPIHEPDGERICDVAAVQLDIALGLEYAFDEDAPIPERDHLLGRIREDARQRGSVHGSRSQIARRDDGTDQTSSS